jgi:ligand-binding SRPBCC domain-containing protein
VLLHRLHRRQLVRSDLDEVWAFFSDPHNLDALTPPQMRFAMLSTSVTPARAGQILRYRIRLLPGVRLTWVSEITHLDPGRSFVDEQRFGPYRFWHHRHGFEARAGGVVVEDDVHYALPFGPVGELAHVLDVRRRLESIFDYRARAMTEYFEARSETPPRSAARRERGEAEGGGLGAATGGPA